VGEPNTLTRRRFVQNATGAGATGLVAPYFVPAKALGKSGTPGANDRIQLALIGAGGMGRVNLRNCARFPEVVVTGVCDVWKERRDRGVNSFKESAKPYHDYREMLQQEDVDAVVIATPPHWHCLQAVHACEAGKDIFLQKPMTLHVAEGLAVKRAAEKHNRIIQIGTQVHSGDNYPRVVELVRSGRLGPISVVRTFHLQNQGVDGIQHINPSLRGWEEPKDLDWDFWVGPAPMRPFDPVIVQDAASNSSFMDYSGGWTPGMGPHIVDLPFWALKLDFPTKTTCAGGRYVLRDVGDVPDTQEVSWEFANLAMTWSQSMVHTFFGSASMTLGIYFHAVNGTLFADYNNCRVEPETNRMEKVELEEQPLDSTGRHEKEWLDCIRTRKQPSCNASYHYKIDVALALANLSYKVGRSIRFDPTTEKIIGDAEAAQLAQPKYRDPWKFPAEYL